MADVDGKQANAWLHDDNRVLLATLATLTLATGSVLLWRGKRRAVIQLPDVDPEGRSSFLQSTLAALHLSGLASSASSKGDSESDQAPPAASTALREGGNAGPAKDPKNSRSKERRRRGKDPLKDLSSKKLKDLLRAQTKRLTTASSEDLPTLPPMENKPDVARGAVSLSPGSADEEDRRHSPTRSALEDATTPKASPSSRRVDSMEPSQEDASPAASTSRAASVASEGLSALSTNRRPVTPPPASTNGPTTSSSPSPSSEASQTSSLLQSTRSSQTPDWSSSSSYADMSIPSSDTVTATTSARGKSSSGASWDWDGQSTFYRDPPPRFAPGDVPSASRSGASPVPVPKSPLPRPAALSPSPSPGPSRPRRTPTPRVGRGQNETTPPPPTSGIALSSHTQIASLKGALEAAKMREEKNRLEAERLAKEVEMANWRWSKDAGHWRRREIEMNNYIQYLVHNLNLYASASASASAQTQQPPSHPATPAPGSAPLPPLPFSPFSPSGTPFPFPAAGPSFPPYLYPPQHAAQHQTLATFFPGATSSGSRSPDRGRRRERGRAEDEEGEGAKEAGGGDEDESEEELHLSDEVAGAILKRPDSLRVKKRRRGERSIPVGAGVDAGGSTLEDVSASREREGSGDEVDAFVFPSISDLGNPYIHKEKEAEVDLDTGDSTVDEVSVVAWTDEDTAPTSNQNSTCSVLPSTAKVDSMRSHGRLRSPPRDTCDIR